MTDAASPRLSHLIRDTEGFLLPLTEATDDVVVTRVEFDFDLHADTPTLTGTVVLITEAVAGSGHLDALIETHRGAAALILSPGTHDHLTDAPANRQGESAPVLLERSPAVTWSEVLVHLRQLREGAASTLAWPDVDDLSALAAVIAETTGASITIEDPASRVLAHANLGDELDEIRRETILSGAIPGWRIAELEESGFLDTVRRSTDVVERPADGATPARSVIALRSEGELIGTIWAAYPESVAPESLREVLRDAARAALPVMLRTLRRSPFEKRIRREALGSILLGAADLGPAATLLALPFSGHYAALAFAEVAPEREPALRFHLRAAFADAVLAHDDRTGRLAVLVHIDGHFTAAEVKTRVLAALKRSLPSSGMLLFGVGCTVERLDHVHRAWKEAVDIVDALLSRGTRARGRAADTSHPPERGPAAERGHSPSGRDSSTVTAQAIGATADDVAAELIGLTAADALRAADSQLPTSGVGSQSPMSGTAPHTVHPPFGSSAVSPQISAPARALAAHDAEHNGQLLETLRVYFATVGNSAEASRRLHVHTNSLRHRLGRIEEITGLSTSERAERLWLELSVLVVDRETALGSERRGSERSGSERGGSTRP
ncbi:PucR family transcriptional regulator [Brevibacterium atlanticum]|uniref:PucR family transcriptional regulator n=1 Tax=Brevibacterium atlanticum TaxID=2697563 RepID=UPI001423557D|nr:helix-turn-helix domain-containing protein [Brevibacterium atlanticum]